MKKITFLLVFAITILSLNAQTSTMTFDSGATEPNFSFVNWTGSGGTIFISNLGNPATVSNANGFDFISFEVVTGFLSDVDMQVTSNTGDTYNYNTNVAQTHTLNWENITQLTFTRTSTGGASTDHDNFVYAPAGTLSTPSFDDNKISFSIFPNPSLNLLNISDIKNLISYEIYTVLGKRVQYQSISKKINVSDLKKGLYLIKFIGKGKTITKKFIKQ